MLVMEWKIMVLDQERKEVRRVGGKKTRDIYLFYAPLSGQVRARDSLWAGANAVIRGERVKHAEMKCGEVIIQLFVQHPDTGRCIASDVERQAIVLLAATDGSLRGARELFHTR
jgi:hypothetical protein